MVLPAPLGPSSPVTPGFRSRSTPASARVAPNVRPTSRRLIEAVTIATSTVEAGAAGAGAGERSTNEAAASARKAAWARAWSTDSGEPDRVASSQTIASQAKLTAMAARSGLTQVDAARTTVTKPTAGSSQANAVSPGTTSPKSSTAGQRERENRDRAQQDQPERRVGRDEFRFERRVHPRVVAGRDHEAGHDRRHGQEQPLPAGVPDRRRERGEREDRGHAGQPHAAEGAGHRDQPRLVGGQAGATQQPLEHRRPRHFDGVPGAVPYRGEVDHSPTAAADPRPALLAGQQVLLGRGPFGQRIGPLDVASQRVVVEVPAGHDDPSARAARRCALAR